jgi:antitoxin MazE
MRLHLARWGNSLAVRLPVDCLRATGLKEGDAVEVEVTPSGELHLRPAATFDRGAFVERLRRLRARLPTQPESAAAFVRQMRDSDRY